MNVFICYSHSDANWLKRLKVHLAPLERHGSIVAWDDTKLEPGQRWRDQIEKALNNADIAILLISADFIASDFIAKIELPNILNAAEMRGLTVLSLIIMPCRFEREQALASFQAINSPSAPLASLPIASQEEIFDQLVITIESLALPEDRPEHVFGLADPKSNIESPSSVFLNANRFFVPFSRPTLFGRQAALIQLDEQLNNSKYTTVSSLLTGQGGIGKTQLAVAYAYRYRRKYPGGCFWVNMAPDIRPGVPPVIRRVFGSFVRQYASLVGIDSSGFHSQIPEIQLQLATFTQRMQIVERDKQEKETLASLVGFWFDHLAAHKESLVILDNLEDPKLLDEKLTKSDYCKLSNLQCHILITSRLGQIAPGNVFYVDHLSQEPSNALLTFEACREPDSDDEVQALNRLSNRLGGLPLALKIAGGILRDNRLLTYGDFDEALKRRGALYVLDQFGSIPSDYQSRMIKSFSALFEQSWSLLTERDPKAIEVVKMLAAFPENEFIPIPVLRWFFSDISGYEKEAIAEPVADAINSLFHAHFVEIHRAKEVRLHPLVREFVQSQTDTESIKAKLMKITARIEGSVSTLATLSDKTDTYEVERAERLLRVYEALGLSHRPQIDRDVAQYIAEKL